MARVAEPALDVVVVAWHWSQTLSTIAVPMLRTILIIGQVLVMLIATACSDEPSSDGLRIVASTPIWADVAENVAGDGATVSSLMPAGGDPHDFRPSSQDLARAAEADLVILNGLGLEEGLESDIRGAVDASRLLVLGPALDPRTTADGSADDPHVWLDPLRVAIAADLIAQRLAAIDPDGGHESRADAYRQRLGEADAEIAALLPDDVAVVTDHDFLGYFADRYGIDVVATIVPGGGTHAEPGAAHIAEVIEAIRRHSASLILTEPGGAEALTSTVAAETGATVVEFPVTSPPDGSGVIEMLLSGARIIAEGG